jgi:hypothetical protein
MKLALTLMFLFLSSTAFAMGRTDKSTIQADLSKLESAGLKCDEKWRDGFYMSDVPPQGRFSVELLCTKNGVVAQKGTIIYEVDSNQYARCRDRRAISLELNSLTSELHDGDGGAIVGSPAGA